MKPPLISRVLTLAVVSLVVLAFLSTSTALAGREKDKEKSKGWLGITMQEVTGSMAEAMEVEDGAGVLIQSVIDDSPADEAGLEDGDVIIKYDSQEVEGTGDLVRLVGKTVPGGKVEIEILRDGQGKTIDVVIGERKNAPHVWSFRGDDGGHYSYRFHGDDDDLEDLEIRRRCFPGHGEHKMLFHAFAVDHGYLGVSLEDLTEQLGEYFGVEDGDGALIREVMEDSPAEVAGLQAGDVIVRIDEEDIDSPGDVTSYMKDTEEGDEIKVQLLRNKKDKNFKVTLAEVPNKFVWHEDGDFKLRLPRIEKLKRKALPMPRRYRDIIIEREIEDMDDLREDMEELKKELKELKKILDEG